MAKYSFFLTLLSCLIFGSCQTIEQISIDYMMPAEINFPPELRRVAIVNNVSAIPDNKWIEAEKPISGNEVARAIAYTHGDAGIATESLARAIADGNYFDEVVICDSALRADDKIAREEALSQEEVGELTDKLDVDFLIALENLQLKATKYIHYLADWQCYYGTIDLLAQPTVKIYVPNRIRPMLTITPSDSIFWEEYGNTPAYVENHMIKEEQMLKEASEFAGTIPVKHLLPYWTSATRQLYANGSVYMRDAIIYVRENSWDKAFNLWQQAFETSKSDRKKMYAAHNIAVYHEMKDDIPEAEKWALKAQELARKVEKIDDEKKGKQDLSRIPNYVMISLYFAGILCGILYALILKKTKYKGEPVPFVMELPNYRLPSVKSVGQLIWEKAKDFIQKAFTIIFAATLIVWFLQNFDAGLNLVTSTDQSLLAQIGSIVAPLFAPLGFGDWRVSTALITGFMAKESVVSTLTVLLGGNTALLQTLFTPFTAYVFLIFTLLYTPCVAAIATVRREMGTVRAAAGIVAVQCATAWIVAFAVHGVGMMLGL